MNKGNELYYSTQVVTQYPVKDDPLPTITVDEAKNRIVEALAWRRKEGYPRKIYHRDLYKENLQDSMIYRKASIELINKGGYRAGFSKVKMGHYTELI